MVTKTLEMVPKLLLRMHLKLMRQDWRRPVTKSGWMPTVGAKTTSLAVRATVPNPMWRTDP